MALGGGRFFFLAFWIARKRLRTFAREGLLNFLAISLSLIVILRERNDFTLIFSGNWPGFLNFFVMVISLSVMIAALWGLVGNLKTTQEMRFVLAVRSLLSELEEFSYGKDREFDLTKRLQVFFAEFLEVTSFVLGGKNQIDAGLMVSNGDVLTLIKQSTGAKYPSNINIALQYEHERPGVAEAAFRLQEIVYMPFRRPELSFPFKSVGEVYQPLEPRLISALAPEIDKYRSTLCFPVSSYETRSEKRSFGVLCFSSTTADVFVERDFAMGECFSSILAQVFRVSRTEAQGELFSKGEPLADSSVTESSIDTKASPVSKNNSRSDSARRTLYIRGLELENIRCFESLRLSLEDETGPFLTTVILGDNAAGKSTILRSIALGLCPESDAASLIKNLPGSFLRKGTERGSIVLYVSSPDRSFKGSIHTTIEAPSSGGLEIIRQVTDPVDFPWHEVFVCGYGTQRASGRPLSPEGYEARLAVATLFSDSSDLLNPEVVLLRRDPEVSSRLEQILKQILLLDSQGSGVRRLSTGIELAGSWGSQPLMAVSDGYRSTSQWVLDYLGWQMFADRLQEGVIDGILLVDELEQHLHPRWQRYLLQRMRTQFGQTQIIASTHTPLIAAAVADVDRSQVVRLVARADGSVEAHTVEKEFLTGKRADQILGDAFGLITSKSPGSLAKIDRYTELMSQSRNEFEQKELEMLRNELDDAWSSGDTALSRAAEKVVSKVLDEMIDVGREKIGDGRDIVDAHAKQRLLELFDTREKE
jgi:putative AbiEii toxin of type IV toxin-antitoxin system/AAA domain-containing protein